jgi:polyisoprenoid-binding protein YceI
LDAQTVTVTPGTYRLDPVHSTVGFAVMHKVSRFRAGFAEFDATFEAADDGTLTLSGWAAARSLRLKNPEQEAHLQSPEFLDTGRHPQIVFRSVAVTLGPGNDLSVEGDLTVRGHTERVHATGHLFYVPDDGHDQERIGIDLETVVDRTVFGMRWNQPLPGGGVSLLNEVTLAVELELPKA